MEHEHGTVKFMGIHFKDEKQRKLVMLASIVGIAAFALYMKDRNASGGGSGGGAIGGIGGLDPGAGNDGSVSMPGFGGGGSDNPFQIISDQIAEIGDAIKGGTTLTPGQSIKFDYTQDMSSEFSATGKYSKTSQSGSSFGLGGGGFSLSFGGSSGSSTEREAAFSSTNRDIFSNQSELTGVSDSIISQFLAFSEKIGGNYDQKTTQQKVLQDANNKQANQFIGTNVVGGVEVKQTKNQTINNQSQTLTATNSATI